MNKVNKDELFEHVSVFLKRKGIELQPGPYTRTVEKGCQVLAETINLGQTAVERAKSELEGTLEQVRRVIHEKTAPRKPPVRPQPERPGQEEAPPADADQPEADVPPVLGKKSAPASRTRKKTGPAPKTRRPPKVE